MSLVDFRTAFNQRLFDFLREKRKQAVTINPKCGLLADEIIRFNQAGGKRIRPYFCYLGSCLKYSDPRSVISGRSWFIGAFLAVELLESMALIHDDIMDEAGLRRGAVTTYKKFGRDIAILTGDLLFAMMDESMLDSGRPAQAAFARLKAEIVYGQTLDLLKDSKADFAKLPTAKEVLSIYQYKTAAYTVKRPLQIGYLSSLKTDRLNVKQQEQLKILSVYGDNAGIAFQIIDDLLDLRPTSQTGKTRGGDIKEGKTTYWLVKLVNRLKEKNDCQNLANLAKAYQTKPSQSDIGTIIDLAQKEGIIADCEVEAKVLIAQAKKVIIDFSGSKPAQQKLIEIADYLIARNY